ncbi:putative licodione synthase [Rosa chinensis]|uniref:Putative licodione synthase n=1 Tax=Rosa chinensis TaxID=74649 RepID=A0A2P6QI77_ROSCH|nr:licodione synthase-like [Rosa chinensis]PRQ33881.1 putative licodione synthase [Rosa chinensis]
MALELVLLILFLVLAISIISRMLYHDHLPPSPLALPIIGHLHLLGPLIHRSLHNLSLRFGPLFSLRLGSVPCIVVTSPELAEEFLKTHELTFMSRPELTSIQTLTYNSSFIFKPAGAYWKFMRKLSMTELFNSHSADKFLSIRDQECMRLLRLLAKKAQSYEAVDLSEEIRRLCFGIIGQMIAGKSAMTVPAREAWLMVSEATAIAGEMNFCDFNWVWKKLNLDGYRNKMERLQRRVDERLEAFIVEREELRKKHKKIDGGGSQVGQREVDFLDVLLDLLDAESSEAAEVGFSRLHIKALLADFFSAGIEPIAILLEWALAEIINHPKMLEKARKEIDRVIRDGQLVRESDVPNLPYLQAVIKETLRLHPPLPLLMKICGKQCKIGKYFIPENAFLFVNLWAIGRDPTNWENPLEFWPERFLHLDGRDQTSTLIDFKGQHYQLIPFGSGRRICAGVNLTMKIVPRLLAAMIQCFDWKVGGSDCNKMNNNNVLDMNEEPGLTTRRANNLVCVPVARLNHNIIDP